MEIETAGSPGPVPPAWVAAGTPGSDYLERRSRINKRVAEVVRVHRVQIVDDSSFDADVLASCLRQVLGRDLAIDQAKSTVGLQRQFAAAPPDLVFLDDRLGQGGTATANIPYLRRSGYAGPIIAVSGLLTRERRIELLRLGATGVLHKDEFDSLRIGELLLALFDTAPPGPAGETP